MATVVEVCMHEGDRLGASLRGARVNSRALKSRPVLSVSSHDTARSQSARTARRRDSTARTRGRLYVTVHRRRLQLPPKL